MASNYVVKCPAGEYSPNLEECCEQYLTRRWPDWKTNDRTYMIPPCFKRNYISPTGDASGAVELTETLKGYIKGDSAELQIFQCLERFGRETNQPMFVLSKFSYRKFIKEFFPKDCPLVTSLKNLLETSKRDEIDFVVLHRRIGVILIEAKGKTEFKSDRYEVAKEQLEFAEKFVRIFLEAKGMNEVDFVHKVVAVPNLSDVSESSGGFIHLRKINLEMDGEGNDRNLPPFALWWKGKFTERSLGEHEEKFLSVISLFVGHRATVNASARILGNVFKTINKQKFLQQSHKQTTEEKPVVVRLEKKSILARQFVFLNEEQLAIWRGEEKQLIHGVVGSGKTILIQHKALECVKRNEKVVIFVPTILGKLYKEFFSSNGILFLHFNFKRDSQKLKQNSLPGCSSEFFKKFLRKGKPCDEKLLIVTVHQQPLFLSSVDSVAKEGERVDDLHIFVDEFQSFPDARSLADFCICHQSPSFYQWIAYEVRQQLKHERYVSSFGFDGVIFYLCETKKFLHAPSLTTVMRCTSQIFSTLKNHYEPIHYFDNPEQEKFAEKYWNNEIKLGHHVDGPEIRDIPCRNFVSDEERSIFYVKIINDEINAWAKVDDTVYYNRVAILVTEQVWYERLSSYLEKEGIKHCCIGDYQDNKDAVVLDFKRNAQSYEWPVVIVFENDLRDSIESIFLYVPFSRAVARLVIAWTSGRDKPWGKGKNQTLLHWRL